MSRTRVALLVLASASLSACWTTTADGNLLRSRIDRLERGQEAQRGELRQEIVNAQTKVQALEDVLDRATKLLTRNSADTGAEVEALQQRLMALEGQIAELRHEVERRQAQAAEERSATARDVRRLAKHAGVDLSFSEADIPSDPDALFSAAETARTAGEVTRARALYEAFAQRHTTDPRVAEAHYRVGMILLAAERPATALGELRSALTSNAEGPFADDALLAMAQAFYALHACTDARSALDAFLRSYRSSDRTPEARELLGTVRRAPRSYCTR